jgi:hypothetical protein
VSWTDDAGERPVGVVGGLGALFAATTYFLMHGAFVRHSLCMVVPNQFRLFVFPGIFVDVREFFYASFRAYELKQWG